MNHQDIHLAVRHAGRTCYLVVVLTLLSVFFTLPVQAQGSSPFDRFLAEVLSAIESAEFASKSPYKVMDTKTTAINTTWSILLTLDCPASVPVEDRLFSLQFLGTSTTGVGWTYIPWGGENPAITIDGTFVRDFGWVDPYISRVTLQDTASAILLSETGIGPLLASSSIAISAVMEGTQQTLSVVAMGDKPSGCEVFLDAYHNPFPSEI